MQTAQILFGEVPEHFKGSGYGSGYGDYGYGYGDGSGYGSGGYGYGSHFGSGDGSGDGSKEYWAGVVAAFADKWGTAARANLQKLQKEGHTIAYWRSNAKGEPCNGGSGSAVYPGLEQKIAGPLRLCGSGALHATAIPPKWEGERVWIVALKGEVIWDGDKCGALCREIIGECL